MSFFRLFILNCKNTLSRHMQYRVDFLIGFFVSTIIAFAQPAIQILFFRGVNGFEGWSINQIVVFQGVVVLWMGLKDTLFGRIRTDVQAMIRDGSFDRLLNKPYSVLILIFSGGFNFLSIGTLTAGIIILNYGISLNNLINGVYEYLIFVIYIFFGLILYVSMLIIYCAVVIHLVAMNRLEEIMDKFLRFSEYPVNIYSVIIKSILLLLIPLSLFTYYPAVILLHGFDKLSLISVIVSIVLLFVSIKIFNKSLKKYASTGG